MTEHVGFYCGYCEVRYVNYVCKDRLPCRHPLRDAFYTFQWDYSKGYQRFRVSNEKNGILFDAHNITDEELKEAIEKYCEWLKYQTEHGNIWLFVKNKSPIQLFKEACEHAGGQGWDYPPRWRIEELNKALEKDGMLPRWI